MKSFFKVLFVGFVLFSSYEVMAGAGDYSLRAKIGPSFSFQDWEDQIAFGTDFDYDLGYSMGIGFLTMLGVSDEFRFQMIPTFRYDYLYVGPASFYGLAGAGYSRFNSDNALDLRVGTGLTLPLGENYEVNSDLNLFFTPMGTPGTPITLNWLVSFGFKF